MITDYFKLVLGNLKGRKLRSFLTMIGIIISIATIFILISLSLGLNAAIQEQFRLLGTDKLMISAKGQAGAPGSGGAVQLTIKDVEFIEKIKEVNDLTYYTIGNAKISFGDQQRYYMVMGLPPDSSKVYIEQVMKIEEGRMLKKGDQGKIVLGAGYKYNAIFKRPVKVGNKIFIQDKEFEVIGILKSLGNPTDDSQTYIDYDNFKELFNSGDRVDGLVVQIKSGEDIKKASDKIKKELMRYRNVDEKTIDFDILTPAELLNSFGAILNIITVFLLGVAGISLLVGGIGIANTMYTSVLERTKEIGTMKAIGAKNSDITKIFVIESGFLGLFGGTLGVILGYIVAKIIDYIAAEQLNTSLLQTSTPIYLFIGCLAFAFFSGAIFGLLPAIQASKLKPADTLRYE
jgi:putative ABC transport system permease protein